MKYIALLVFSSVLLGCAGGARSRQAEPSASPGEATVTMVSGSELRAQYGRTFEDNPFLVPKSIATRKSVDFIVLRLTVAGPAELELLQAEAVDESGAACAKFYPKREFTELALFLSAPTMDNMTKQNRIDWYYLPSGKSVRVRAGSHPYLLVLVGKPPFPKTVTARVRLLLGAEERSFDVPVNLETK